MIAHFSLVFIRERIGRVLFYRNYTLRNKLQLHSRISVQLWLIIILVQEILYDVIT